MRCSQKRIHHEAKAIVITLPQERVRVLQRSKEFEGVRRLLQKKPSQSPFCYASSKVSMTMPQRQARITADVAKDFSFLPSLHFSIQSISNANVLYHAASSKALRLALAAAS